MYYRIFCLFIPAFFWLSADAFCQISHLRDSSDKIILMNAKEIEHIKILEVKQQSVAYLRLDKSTPDTLSIYKEKIFSVVYANGKETIFYPGEEDFTPDQMKMFLKGEHDAKRFYRNYQSYAVGFVFGIAGPYLVNFMYPVMLPLPAATGVYAEGLVSPNMNKQPIPSKYLYNEEYLMGYEKKARSMKIKHALVGALLGFAAGWLVFIAPGGNGPDAIDFTSGNLVHHSH